MLDSKGPTDLGFFFRPCDISKDFSSWAFTVSNPKGSEICVEHCVSDDFGRPNEGSSTDAHL